jgi:D-alanine-D-alanine ligase
MLGIPYVGCQVLASSICQDKHFTKVVASQAGIKVAPWVTLNVKLNKRNKLDTSATEESDLVLNQQVLRQIHQLHELDLNQVRSTAKNRKVLFVKPARSGSSVGISKIDLNAVELKGDKYIANSELVEAIEKAAKEDAKVIVEAGVNGREIECAVLGPTYNATASTLGEIVANGEFYDYNSKYINKKTDLIVRPTMDNECQKRLQSTALAAYRALDCTGLSRVDMFLTGRGEVYLNEVNTMPGFTEISMYPKLKAADGLEYSQLIDCLIDQALNQRAGSDSSFDSTSTTADSPPSDAVRRTKQPLKKGGVSTS